MSRYHCPGNRSGDHDPELLLLTEGEAGLVGLPPLSPGYLRAVVTCRDCKLRGVVEFVADSAAWMKPRAAPGPKPHVHTRDCYTDPGPGDGPPFLICNHGDSTCI